MSVNGKFPSGSYAYAHSYAQLQHKNRPTESTFDNHEIQQYNDSHKILNSEVSVSGEDTNNVHFNVLQEWVEEMSEALPEILAKKSTYDRVLFLPIYWERTDEAADHIPGQAKELQAVFRDRFGFETPEAFEIPDESSSVALGYRILGDALKISHKTKRNLFIIYYGGHGVQNKDGKCFWTPSTRVVRDTPLVDCSEFQKYLSQADCDILFLFDCCYATAMINEGHTWKRRCEILGAAGPVNKAGGEPQGSFTLALTKELKRVESDGISVLQLYSNLSGTKKMHDYHLVTVPAYRKFWESYELASISIIPQDVQKSENFQNANRGRVQHSSSYSSSGSSDARVLFSVTFSNPAERPTLKGFQQWLEYRPHNIKDIKISVQRERNIAGFFDTGVRGCRPDTDATTNPPQGMWGKIGNSAGLNRATQRLRSR